MNIAYLLQCHKDFEQIITLISSLYLVGNDKVLIHVDKKNPMLRLKIKEYYLAKDNIFVVDEPISVYWSGFSQIEATLKMLHMIREIGDYDYCCLLSGEDMVLKPKRLKNFLIKNHI